MASIVARGYPTHVDTWEEGPPGSTFTVSSFRLWCRIDAGNTYRTYVDIAWSDLDKRTHIPRGGWPPGILDTLYRSQVRLERDPDVYGLPVTSPDSLRELEKDSESPAPSIVEGFKEREKKNWQDVADWAADSNLPSDPSDPNREHIGGPTKCWCGRTHPPHKPWQPDCGTAPTCWCRERHCGAGQAR